MIQSPDDRYPFQRPVLRGAMAALYNQVLTGKSIGAEVLLEGRAGTGKSIGALTYIVQACHTWPGIRVLLTRFTRASMTESTLVTLEDEVLGRTHPAVANGPGRAHREAYEINGSRIVPVGQDNPDRLFSTNWDIIYANEAHEIALANWELFGRAQRPRMDQAMPFRQRIADVNPTFPRHWLNERATPADDELRHVESIADYKRLQKYNYGPQSGRMRRLISVHQDNPHYWDWQRWGYSGPGLEMMAGLDSMSGSRRARMKDGLWVAAEGSIFPEFDVAKHVVTPFDIRDMPVWMGWDPGANHPTGIPWIARDANGCLYVVDEHYRGGWTVQQHCAEIHAREKARQIPYNMQARYGDPQYAFSSTAFSIITIAQQAEECGIYLEPWPRTINNANELQMIEAVRSLLVAGRLKVFSTCTNTINEFQSWMWQKKANGEPKDEDRPEDRNNDLLDPIRGMIAAGIADTRPKVTISTEPVKPREGLDHVDWERERGPAGRPMAQRAKANRVAVGMV